MITGELRIRIDKISNTFWLGGVSDPLSVIQQMTYLLFARRLNELQPGQEAQANLLKKPIEDPIFSKMRHKLWWFRFMDFEPEIEYEEAVYEKPLVILDQREALEKEIAKDLKQLRKMVTK